MLETSFAAPPDIRPPGNWRVPASCFCQVDISRSAGRRPGRPTGSSVVTSIRPPKCWTHQPLGPADRCRPQHHDLIVDVDAASTGRRCRWLREERGDCRGVVGECPALRDLAVPDVIDLGGPVGERLAAAGGRGVNQRDGVVVVGDDVVQLARDLVVDRAAAGCLALSAAFPRRGSERPISCQITSSARKPSSACMSPRLKASVIWRAITAFGCSGIVTPPHRPLRRGRVHSRRGQMGHGSGYSPHRPLRRGHGPGASRPPATSLRRARATATPWQDRVPLRRVVMPRCGPQKTQRKGRL